MVFRWREQDTSIRNCHLHASMRFWILSFSIVIYERPPGPVEKSLFKFLKKNCLLLFTIYKLSFKVIEARHHFTANLYHIARRGGLQTRNRFERSNENSDVPPCCIKNTVPKIIPIFVDIRKILFPVFVLSTLIFWWQCSTCLLSYLV